MTLEESVQHVVMEAIQEVGAGIPYRNPEGLGEGTFISRVEASEHRPGFAW